MSKIASALDCIRAAKGRVVTYDAILAASGVLSRGTLKVIICRARPRIAPDRVVAIPKVGYRWGGPRYGLTATPAGSS